MNQRWIIWGFSTVLLLTASQTAYAGVDLSSLKGYSFSSSSVSFSSGSRSSNGFGSFSRTYTPPPSATNIGFDFTSVNSWFATPKRYTPSANTCRTRSLLTLFGSNITAGEGIAMPGLIWGDCPISAAMIKVKVPANSFGGPLDF